MKARDTVLDGIQGRIGLGILRPNATLVESDLAQQFGTSRTPVREALLEMEFIGAAVRKENGTCIVADFTATDVANALVVREQLESLALRLSCSSIGKRQLDEARKSYEAATTAMLENSIAEYILRHRCFHEQLYAACDNPLLLRLVSICRHHTVDYRLVRLYTRPEWKSQVQLDGQLLDAVYKGNAAVAVERLRLTFREALRIAVARL